MKLLSIAAYLLTAVIGYLFGSVSFAVLISRFILGGDIRKSGSKNAGATNMARVYGIVAGILTFVGDALKTVLAMLLGKAICGEAGFYIAAVTCLLGHCFPVFFKFKGGKGVAVGGAIAFMINPVAGGILLAVFVIIVLLTKIVSAASLAAALVFPIAAGILCGVTKPGFYVALFTAVNVWYMHRSNITRLRNGTEKKFSAGQKNNINNEK